MGIEKKSFSMLLDEFVTNQLRCWFAQEDVMKGGTDAEVAAAAKKAQETNNRRNQLMRAIDEMVGDANTPLSKSYDVTGKMGTQVQSEEFWAKYGVPKLDESGTETGITMIEFDPDRLMIFGGEPKFNYAAGNLPVIYDHDKMVKAVTYAYKNSYSMSVTVYGEFYWRDSCEVTGFDSPNFENVILAYDWLYEEAMKHE